MVVGWASAIGLKWLGELSGHRQVHLLIGDTCQGFSKYSEEDRGAAVRFLQRPDVSVRNWYSKKDGYRMAHAKAWIAEANPGSGYQGAALLGLANLTRHGLFNNAEMMSAAHPGESPRLFAEMQELMAKSWPIEDKLLEKLGAQSAAAAELSELSVDEKLDLITDHLGNGQPAVPKTGGARNMNSRGGSLP